MTTTEDRLTDALAAVARGVREESLPPLLAAGPVRRRWVNRLAPLAAAAAVTLVVVLISVVHLGPARPGGTTRAAGLPRYYAAMVMGSIAIRSTATGAVTANVPVPFQRPGAAGWQPMGVAAVGHEFLAAFAGPAPGSAFAQTRLYSFHLTAAGRIAGFSLIRGGVLDGWMASPAVAFSPDGSRIALAVYRGNYLESTAPAAIMVVDLATGAHTLWQGGLARPGTTFKIPSLSWGAGARSLVFLAEWCRPAVVAGSCGAGSSAAQVRTLGVTAGGGPLTRGSVLLSQSARYPEIVQALAGPGGKDLILAVLSGHGRGKPYPIPQRLRVLQVPVSGGGPRLLYHSATGDHLLVFLGTDVSGRHLLLAWQLNGWIVHGGLHLLAPQNGQVYGEAW